LFQRRACFLSGISPRFRCCRPTRSHRNIYSWNACGVPAVSTLRPRIWLERSSFSISHSRVR
jgi:hypothetical protein